MMNNFKLFTVVLLAGVPLILRGDLVGGEKDYPTDFNDPYIIFAVNATNAYFASLGDNAVRIGDTLVKATSQVVAGIAYRFTIRFKGGPGIEECKIRIWSRPWLPGTEALQVTEGPFCTIIFVTTPPRGS